MTSATPSSTPPESILIIGAGVFGISTTLSLLKSPRYDNTRITVVDAYAPDPESKDAPTGTFSSKEITASLDTSRIIRPDYPNPLYAALADEATGLFRTGWAESHDGVTERTYTQPGLVLVSSGPKDSRGTTYLQSVYQNTLKLANNAESKDSHPDARAKNSGLKPVLFPTSRDVEEAIRCPPESLPESMTGYINPQAGWANASAAISAVKQQVLSLGRARESEGKASFQFLSSTKVSSLLFSTDKIRVVGATLDSSDQILATITILATGSWTPSLLPSLFAPRLRASGQVLTYISLHSSEEVLHYAGRPTVMDTETGMFAIFPPEHYIAEQRTEGHIKIARHGWGYSHTVSVPDPLDPSNQPISCHLPLSAPDQFFHVPSEGMAACRDFQSLILPELKDRAFSAQRTCWYTDTPTGDFLIDFIPELQGLLLATGGSGHGFKFLPVIGGKIVAKLEGNLEEGLADLWRWKSREECEELWMGEGDTSRGGKKGMVWEEEVARS